MLTTGQTLHGQRKGHKSAVTVAKCRWTCSYQTSHGSLTAAQLLRHVWLVVTPMDCSPPGSSVHGTFQAKNTGVSYHFLLRGIFPAEGLNLYFCVSCLFCMCRCILYHWTTVGSPSTSEKVKVLVIQSCLAPCNPTGYSPPGSPIHGINSPGRNTGVGSHFLLQGIFLNQGLNTCLLHIMHCRQILYHLSHQGRLYVFIITKRNTVWNCCLSSLCSGHPLNGDPWLLSGNFFAYSSACLQ